MQLNLGLCQIPVYNTGSRTRTYNSLDKVKPLRKKRLGLQGRKTAAHPKKVNNFKCERLPPRGRGNYKKYL